MVRIDDVTAPPPSPRRSFAPAGPVVLATMSARIDSRAEAVATAAALEAGVAVVVVNVRPLPACLRTLAVHGVEAATLPGEEDYDAVRAAAERIAAAGAPVELLRITAPRPVDALLETAAERRAGLLVLGPDARRVRGRRLRAAARAIRRRASCLVWIAADV